MFKSEEHKFDKLEEELLNIEKFAKKRIERMRLFLKNLI